MRSDWYNASWSDNEEEEGEEEGQLKAREIAALYRQLLFDECIY